MDDGLLLLLRAQPGARRNGFAGLMQTREGPALRVAVTEAAEKGRANRAIIALLARALGVPKSAITMVRGEGSRLKLVHVAPKGKAGDALQELQQRLAHLADGQA